MISTVIDRDTGIRSCSSGVVEGRELAAISSWHISFAGTRHTADEKIDLVGPGKRRLGR